MAGETSSTSSISASTPQEKRHRSIFDLPSDFFDGCRLISPTSEASPREAAPRGEEKLKDDPNDVGEERSSQNGAAPARWTCNTCKAEFESLLDQRSHFKSDIHRLNVKLSVAGKDIVKEEDFDELAADSFDVSSISGSEDEGDSARKGSTDINKQNLFIRLKTGERVSLWKCLLLNESENISYLESDKGGGGGVAENEVVERLRRLIGAERDGLRLRIVLLALGGHFAGCVFDGSSVVAHKTFHRYVVRGKAGKKQSSKDAGGRSFHSAGAALRRYNELGLKKDIQELLASWKEHFDACSCIFIHAPSSNRQLLYDGDRPYFSQRGSVVRNVPVNVRRPTFKESRRVYNQLTQVAYEVDKEELKQDAREDSVFNAGPVTNGSPVLIEEDFKDRLMLTESTVVSSSGIKAEKPSSESENERERESFGTTTPLHDAARSSDYDKVMQLLEQGLDPSAKDERGRTPYMLANEKEVRNAFRRFMASNPNRWDWIAAKVPSALTKEMEESQAAKQAEKDAKRKARAKELKKLRKAREKKAQAESSSSSLNAGAVAVNGAASASDSKGLSQPSGRSQITKEEELKRTMAIEREKRAAAAEKRLLATAAVNAQGTGTSSAHMRPSNAVPSDSVCSCCHALLAGIVPFHRYNYKYCSTSCMHVHREIIEKG